MINNSSYCRNVYIWTHLIASFIHNYRKICMALHSVTTNGRKQNEREAQRFHFYNEIKLFQYLEWYVFMGFGGRLLMVLILSFKAINICFGILLLFQEIFCSGSFCFLLIIGCGVSTMGQEIRWIAPLERKFYLLQDTGLFPFKSIKNQKHRVTEKNRRDRYW